TTPRSARDSICSSGRRGIKAVTRPAASTPTQSLFFASSAWISRRDTKRTTSRSEEHTSELQSLTNLVCRLLLEKKKTYTTHASAKVHHSSHSTWSSMHHVPLPAAALIARCVLITVA